MTTKRNHWRIDISNRPGVTDAHGHEILGDIRDLGIGGVGGVASSRIFLVDGPLSREQVIRIAAELLADPVCERFDVHGEGEAAAAPEGATAVEVFFKTGVMDPVALSAQTAIADFGMAAETVRTGKRYVISPALDDETVRLIIRRVLTNGSIEDALIGSRPAGPAPEPAPYTLHLRTVPLRDLDDTGLATLSRDGHLFLNLEEMQAIQAHYRDQGRDPTDVELETFAQTWSEHCVHKTFKSAVTYTGEAIPAAPEAATDADGKTAAALLGEPAGDGRMRYRFSNLLKDTVAAATFKLAKPWCLSVFVDNAGIIDFERGYGVAFKVETHNHPSAIEPYGGAATGIGGVIRDIVGCGLAAKPIANTDVFCFALPDLPLSKIPRGILHPRRVAKGVVAGVRDYGNRMGIPTVNGAVYFDPRYLGNPLVYAGCLGLIPVDRIEKAARPGDAVLVVGGRTGRDGIHGATFSSAELTDTHAEEFAHAVQIGNAITEKTFTDVILQARDHEKGCLYTAITDCGAGGLSSAVGEMAEKIGAEVDLEKVPLKYAGLRYDEIWISEAQERMVLSVPPENLETILALFAAEDVEATVIGTFRDDGRLVLRYDGQQVGRIDCEFLHNGVPGLDKVATWTRRAAQPPAGSHVRIYDEPGPLAERLLKLMAHPTLASKQWVIRQYDHEVQAGSALKPLTGKCNDGPADAAVVRPLLDSRRGVAIANGLAPHFSDWDPYWMAVASVDEAIRNVTTAGADPARIAILDNFCWPKTEDPEMLGSLVRAARGAHDAALAFDAPFVSGKDSLNNEFALDPADAANLGFAQPRIRIPATLLISAIGIVEDVAQAATMDLKGAGNLLVLVGPNWVWPDPAGNLPFDWTTARAVHLAVSRLVRSRQVASVHDCSEGGILAAIAEMCIAGRRGAVLDTTVATTCKGAMAALYAAMESSGRTRPSQPATAPERLTDAAGSLPEDVPLASPTWTAPIVPLDRWLLAEAPSRYVLEVTPSQMPAVAEALADVPWTTLGLTGEADQPLTVQGAEAQPVSVDVEALRKAWMGTLDW